MVTQTIREMAKADVKSKSKIRNISELQVIDVDLLVFEETKSEFPYLYTEVNNERFKIPVSVLSSLKEILEESPNLKKFKVKKSGEGMETRYTVIPIF